MKIKVKAIGNRPVREVCDWEKLTKALENVNGRAEAHTADCSDIVRAAIDAEKNLDTLKILKRDRKDARFVFVSGDSVANSYNNKGWRRAATRVELRRGAQAGTWFAVDIKRTEIDKQGGSYTSYLTTEQAKIATDKFCSQFIVLK